MAHEMAHYRQHLTGKKDTHGASFQAMAKRICAVHGCFDPKTF
jgi:predicted SprT family Zn-dependent metalloprotease